MLAKKRSFFNSALILLSLVLLTSCGDRPIRDARILMGTNVTLTLYSSRDASYMQGAFDLIRDIEKKISINDEDSEISKVNRMAGKESVVVSREVFELVRYALEVSEETDGLFNPLIGSLTKLWNIGSENERVPEEWEIENALTLIDRDDIVLNESDSSIFLKREGMKIDLGGIGKGYAADRLKEYFAEKDVDKAIINLGGNIYVLGEKDKNTPWRVGIRDPEGSDESICTLEVVDKSVVTSGSYERFFVKDGVTYHHILDPRTGYPSQSELLSSSVISTSSTLSDALSTAIFIGGVEYAERLSDIFKVGVVLYTKDHKVILLGDEYIHSVDN